MVSSKTLTYLENHQDKRCSTDAYRQQGLPLTSSLMESAVKQIKSVTPRQREPKSSGRKRAARRCCNYVPTEAE